MARRLWVYGTAHFFVDFACALFLFGGVKGSDQWYLCLLVYNFFAFALQLPLGVLADEYGRAGWFAAAGCLLTAVGGLFTGYALPAAAMLGLGNALFHIGGGVDVLRTGGAKAGPLGVFVSPGAIGLYLGTQIGKTAGVHWLAGTLPLLAAGVCCLTVGEQGPVSSDVETRCFQRCGPVRLAGAALCLLLVVCLRSYLGFAMAFPWKQTGAWGAAAVLALALGKTAGGFLGDWLGYIRASVLSLGLSAVLFLFSSQPLAGTLAIFLFNMTMPITLWALARLLPGREGFAFGLLTFGLFLGFLPVYFKGTASLGAPLFFAAMALLSLILLTLGLLPLPKKP